MKRAFTAAEIQAIEQKTIKDFGIPSLVLMENAGRAVAEEAARMLNSRKSAKVLIVCGPGNNGGDGFVAARYLLLAGYKVSVWVVGNKIKMKADPGLFYKVITKMGIPIMRVTRESISMERLIKRFDLVIDALFGIGLNKCVQGVFLNCIEIINRRARRILSVDIPSGLHTTTGRVLGDAIKATKTISFTAAKKGFYINDGPALVGDVAVVDIGIPVALLRRRGN